MGETRRFHFESKEANSAQLEVLPDEKKDLPELLKFFNKNVWKKHFDRNTNRNYYVNKATKEAVWLAPVQQEGNVLQPKNQRKISLAESSKEICQTMNLFTYSILLHYYYYLPNVESRVYAEPKAADRGPVHPHDAHEPFEVVPGIFDGD